MAATCLPCQKRMIKYGMELRDWKTAETEAGEIVAEAQVNRNVAPAHYQFAIVLINEGIDKEGIDKRKDELFTRAHHELTKALATVANFPDAVLADGQALAHLRADDAAKTLFEQFVKMRPADDPDRSVRCDISASPSWPGRGWHLRLPSRPRMVNEFRWMI